MTPFFRFLCVLPILYIFFSGYFSSDSSVSPPPDFPDIKPSYLTTLNDILFRAGEGPGDPDDFCKNINSFSVSEHLIKNTPSWSHIVNHKFTTALATNTLPTSVFARYLEQDFLFVETFTMLLASTAAHTANLQDRLPTTRFLDLISSEENDYFVRSFAALNLSKTSHIAVTREFDQLMRDVASSGSLLKMLALLVVAEGSYSDWAERAKRLSSSYELPFYYAEWITLHSGPEFSAVVKHFKGLLDKEFCGQKLLRIQAEARDIEWIFAYASRLEVAFFDAAYD